MNKKKDIRTSGAEEKLRNFKEFCRSRSMKITPQRVAIYMELLVSKKHPSATAIHRKIKDFFPNISLGTVNSTLLVFAELGLAAVVESSGEPKRFDANLEPHHHFKCIKCGKIVDFISNVYDNLTVPVEIEERYTVLGKKVHLDGLCDKCKNDVTR